MRCFVTLLLFSVITSCGVVPQPESMQTVAAFEVPLLTATDRDEFLTMLGRYGRPFGFHVDAASQNELDAAALPNAKNSINATVWRGDDDDESIASVMDFQKPGFAWILFHRGEKPVMNNRFQTQVMAAVKVRWPDTTSLPIMPNGAIPLPSDLIKTKAGYIIDPAAAPKYQIGN